MPGLTNTLTGGLSFGSLVRVAAPSIAVPYVRSTSSGSGVVAGSVAASVPPGAANGDFLVAVLGSRTTSAVDPAASPPTGWTSVISVRRSTNSWVTVYSKVYDATNDPASWTFTYATGGSLGATLGLLAVVGAGSIDGTPQSVFNGGLTPTVVTPAITPSVPGALVLRVAHTAVGSTGPFGYTWPGPTASIADFNLSLASYTMTNGVAQDRGPSPAAAVPAVSATYGATGSYVIGITLALKP